MSSKYQTVRTIGYDGRYNRSNADLRACGGVVHIQERRSHGRTLRRAVTTNGRFSFATKID